MKTLARYILDSASAVLFGVAACYFIVTYCRLGRSVVLFQKEGS